MKTITSLKFIIALFGILAFTLAIKSCKKADNINPLQDAETTKSKSIQAVKDKYGNFSASIIIPVNKTTSQTFYKDANGKMVSIDNQGTLNTNSPTGGPCYTCLTATTAGQLHFSYTLNYVQRWYKCESGDKSTLTANWTISVPFIPSYFVQDYLPNTYGYLEITAPGGGSPLTHYSYAAISPYDFTMKSLGHDPACLNNNIYEVSYNFTNVPDSYFGSGAQINGKVSVDCSCASFFTNVNSGTIGAPALSNNSYLPCNRVDKVFVVPNTGPSNCATAAGCYILCTNPGGFAPINYHEVEYRKVTSGNSLLWDDQISGSTIHWGEPTGTSTESPTINPYTGVSNLIYMTPSSGTWLVRYRNVKTSICDIIYGPGSTPGGNWGSNFTWVTEIWAL